MKHPYFILTGCLLTLCLCASHAAYLSRVPVTVQQPDGALLNCLATGDEFHNWLHDENDYTILQDPVTGYYVYATLKAGLLRPSALLPGRDDPARAGLVSGVNIPPEEWARKREACLSTSPPDIAVTPTTGTINNIVIFIRFKNESEFTDPVSYYSDLFTSSTPGANSMYNYLREASYNKLSVFSSYYPLPTGTTVISYQDAQVRDYYRVYNAAANPLGYQNDTERQVREHTLLSNAVVAVRSQIPTTLNIDADNDGFVDNVCFIVSGSTEAWASLLWPHKWSLYTSTVLINNKRVYQYNFQLRAFLNSRGTGVLCHEMLHSLGAPDLYHYSGSLSPVGSWDIMASTANPPQHPTTFLKYKYLKWISAIPEITTSGQYSLSPTTNSSNNSFRIASPNSTQEYFIAEYRRKTGTFERSLPDEGLIVCRINPVTNGNAGGPPDEVYIYRPNGTSSGNGTISQANFSFSTGRTMFSDSTNPNPFLANNGEGGLCLTEIGSAGNTISFIYQKPGMLSITSNNLVLGQQGTVSVVVVSPTTADYEVEVRDKNGTGTPPWTWSPTLTPAVQVSAGRHRSFSFSVQPTYTAETFRFSLLRRDIGGAWVTFASQEVTLNATAGGKGNITITTADAEGWPGPFDKATVKLFDSTGTQIGTAKTNSSSVASFVDIPSGTGYSYKVFYYQGKPPFGEQYWGTKKGVSVVANATTNTSFFRNAPYAPVIMAYDSSTNVQLTTRDTVLPGTTIRIELTVKNPNNPGAIATSSRARVIVDGDKTPFYDFEQASSNQPYAVGQSKTISFMVTLTVEGQYYFAGEVLSDVGGVEMTTDAGIWGDLLWVRGGGLGTGDLSITVSDAEDWGGAGNSATIHLFNNSGQQIGLQTTDGASTAIFSGVATGMGYSYNVHYLSNTQGTPFGEQFWGSKAGIVITRGMTTYESFVRNLPYAQAINIYDSLTNADVAYDTVHSGVSLRADLRMKNPAYAGAQPGTCRGRIVLDRDQVPPYDFDRSTEWKAFGLNETKEMSVFFKPSLPGAYYVAAAVSTEISGVPTLTDAGKWDGRPLVIVEGLNTSGDLVITLLNAENWGQPGAMARVVLYNSSGVQLAQGQANSSSVVIFSNVPVGTGYYYRVYVNKPSPWEELFWGEKTGITINANEITYDTCTRNATYMPVVSVYIDNTNELLPDGGLKPVQPGTRLRIELQIKNPAYAGAQTVSAYGGLYLDRDQAAPYDVNLTTSPQTYLTGTTKIAVFYCDAPSMPGDYYLSVGAFASSNRYATTLTDASGWHAPAFTVVNPAALPPWKFTNTGISHTIIIPTAANPNINGTTLVVGDYIGAFYDSSGTLACAGYERWTGSSSIAVSAFGDDPTSGAKDGFTAGEVFKWRTYRANDAKVYDAEATYSAIGGVISHTKAYATNGISQLSSLVGGIVTQCQNLRAGWSLISSYVTPQKPTLDSVFKPVVSDVIIVKNGAQKTYIPSVPVNSIGSWVNTEGYQIKMSNARNFCVAGEKIVPWALTIGLPLGWSIMPYVRDSDMLITSALSGVVGDIVLVKDQDGKTYIPSVAVNGIGTLKVGQAYQIKMTAARTIEYPANAASATIASSEVTVTRAKHSAAGPSWFFTNTGISHTFIISTSVNPAIDGAPLAAGDYIGVFYDSSGTMACAGYEPWTGTTNVAISAFGDDATTTAKDGLAAREPLRWKIWRQTDGHVFVARATYQSSGAMGGIVTDTSKYNTNGISAISSLSGSVTNVKGQPLPTEFVLMQNYPNPFNPSTRIAYGLPSNVHVKLTVLNTLGQEVATLVSGNQEAGYHEVEFDAAGLSSGVYFYRLRAGDFVETKRLLLLK